MTDSLEFIETDSRISIPVAVVLERTIDHSKKWAFPNWRVYAIVAGASVAEEYQQITLPGNDEVFRSFHSGLKLELFKDGSEGYWYNLLSEEPYLFVICEGEQGDMEIEPNYVTANQDEATGYLESDDIVLSAPMPVELRDLLERYVISHYQPAIKKKRKRKDWLEDSLYAGSERDSTQDKVSK